MQPQEINIVIVYSLEYKYLPLVSLPLLNRSGFFLLSLIELAGVFVKSQIVPVQRVILIGSEGIRLLLADTSGKNGG